jgi:hypothetical protein
MRWILLEGAASTARAAASISSRLQRARDGCGCAADLAGDGSDCREVAVGGDGESGLEASTAEGCDLVGQAEFFLVVHGAAGDCSPSRRTIGRERSRARPRTSKSCGVPQDRGRYTTGNHWTQRHRCCWLAGQIFQEQAHGIVFQDYLETVWTAQDRRDALVKRISAMVATWSLGPLVEALRGLRGVDLISVATFIGRSQPL